MSDKIIETPTIIFPEIEIDNDLLKKIKHQTNTEQQVIVHCYFYPESFFTRYRVWRTTYLKDKHSSHRSQLLNAYNISFYPIWTPVIGMGKVSFTLVFEGLPKDCKSFDLIEDIPVSKGFFVGSINRTSSDIYTLEVGV